MKVGLLRQLIVIVSFTCAAKCDQIHLINPSREDYKTIKGYLKSAFNELSEITQLYIRNETAKSGMRAYEYYVSNLNWSFLNIKQRNEQWEYFFNNHLKESYQDANDSNESSWVNKYAHSIVSTYVQVVYKDKANSDLISLIVEDEKLFSEVLRLIYKLHAPSIHLYDARKFGRECKKVGILLKIEGEYKSVNISFEGVERVEITAEIFSHAEFINKYTMGSDQELITTYCQLFFQGHNHHDKLCSKFIHCRRIENIVIERIYYTLNIGPYKWTRIYPNKNTEDIDFSQMLIDGRLELQEDFNRKRKHDQTSAQNNDQNSKLIELLTKLSYSRYVDTNKVMTKAVLMKLFDDPYLKYEEMVVFSRAERESDQIQMSEKTQFLSKQFMIPQTFKVIILKNSSIDMAFLALVDYMGRSINLMSEVILKLADLQAGYKKDGMDSFLFGNLQAYNLEKWNFIKTNFINKMLVSDSLTYLEVLEYFIIRDIATIYSNSKGIDVNRWQQGLNSNKHEFLNPIIWKLYVYTYELKAGEEKHISQVKIRFMVRSYAMKITNKYDNKETITINQTEDFNLPDLNDTVSWTEFLIKIRWIPKLGKRDITQWVKDNLIFEKVTPVLIVPENLLIKYQPSLATQEYQYNRSFLYQVLEFSMKMLNTNYEVSRRDVSLIKWELGDNLGLKTLKNYITHQYKSKTGSRNLFQNNNLLENLFEVKNVQPSWFKHYISSENFLTLRPTIPALFFREFHIVEKDVEAKT